MKVSSVKRVYRVTNKEVSKTRDGYYVSWVYGGKPYWAQGEFSIDDKGYLHHSHISATGKVIPFKVKVI